MENLMSEATDLVLSTKRNSTSDPNKVLQWRSRSTSYDSAELSSITLLRLSITESLKDRSKSEVIDTNTLQRKKRRRRRGSSSGKPKIDVQMLNSDNTICAITEDNDRNSLEDSSKSDVPEESLPKLFTEASDSDEADKLQSKQTENDTNDICYKDKISSNTRESPAQKNIAENGMKLARRNFSDSIFENCSTYSLSCEDVVQADNNAFIDNSPSDGGDNWSSGDISSKSGFSAPYLSKIEKSASADNDISSDDQVSLSDSFFGRVNSEENSFRSSIFSKESDCSTISRMSSRLSISKENDLPPAKDFTEQNLEKQNQKSERRLSKKWRKKHKKSKSIDVPTYECPKCGVSYTLSNNTSMSTARCLHCDFWKSVEPVFLKSEKQPWNTCRIC